MQLIGILTTLSNKDKDSFIGPQEFVVGRVVKLFLCAYYYCYYYYFIYLNILLLLLLRHIFRQPNTITITITRHIKKAYYYYFLD